MDNNKIGIAALERVSRSHPVALAAVTGFALAALAVSKAASLLPAVKDAADQRLS